MDSIEELAKFDSRVAIVAIICMLGPVVMSFSRGRYWCGNICPRGSFYDTIVSKVSKRKKVSRIFKTALFGLLVIIIMFTIFGVEIKSNWGNLYGIGVIFYRMIVVTTIIGILLSLFYNHRTWCSFCPMGSISSLVSRIKRSNRVLTLSYNCEGCNRCNQVCTMDISIKKYKGNILSHPDCIQCSKCELVCQKKAI